MNPEKKYDLSKMMAEIEDDIQDQAEDFLQYKDIPQDIITELMIENLKKNKT